jgi:hypothetical protein
MQKKARVSFRNIVAYIQGNVRYKLYYSKVLYGIDLSWLLPKWLREQIELRIESMDRQCYNEGSCKICGCKTTALQFADKSCDKPCYPSMLSRKQWEIFCDTELVFDVKTDMFWQRRSGKFTPFKRIGKTIVNKRNE